MVIWVFRTAGRVFARLSSARPRARRIAGVSATIRLYDLVFVTLRTGGAGMRITQKICKGLQKTYSGRTWLEIPPQDTPQGILRRDFHDPVNFARHKHAK